MSLRAALVALLLAAPARADQETDSLEALRAGRWARAVELLEKWSAEKPGDAYVLRLLARAHESGRTRADAMADVYRRLAAAAPADLRVRARLEELLREEPGVSGRLFHHKAVAPEAVDTPNPLRVLYETREASTRLRARAGARIDALASASARQLSQRNLTRGFSYFDVLEQSYSAGAEVRPFDELGASAEYVHYAFSDIHGAAVGSPTFSGARGRLRWRPAPGWALAAGGEKAPRLLRGAAGSRFFTLLRRASADLGLDGSLASFSVTARAGFDSYSDGVALGRGRLALSREWWFGAVSPSYAREIHEYYGAAADGRFGAVGLDRWGLRWSRWEGPVQAQAQYGWSPAADGNRRHDAEASLESEPALAKGLSARYAVNVERWKALTPLYRSFDAQAHWAGAFWTRGSRYWDARAGAEHGWARDARGPWEGNRASATAAWRPMAGSSVEASLEGLRAGVGDDSFRVSLGARVAF